MTTVINTVNPSALLAVATTPTTTPTTAHYSMLEYGAIIENSFQHFFDLTVYVYDNFPKLTKKKIAEIKEECYSSFIKDRYSELTIEKIDKFASEYAYIKNIEMYELEELGWDFIESLSNALMVPSILLVESEVYLHWSYEYFY